jgi:HEAT repeat protein
VDEPSERTPQEGDELWFGLSGPIRVSDEMTAKREAARAASRIAQAAGSMDDLVALVRSSPDPHVRGQAIPRLRARFPHDPMTLKVLGEASTDEDPHVRTVAVGGLGDIGGALAADLIAARLYDDDFAVRLAAGRDLAFLGDDRAPDDPEVWALARMVASDEDDEPTSTT